MVYRLLLSLVLIFTGASLKAEVLFEGYSKVLSGGVHVGYVINRYEFDSKKKQFISTSFLKTNDAGGGITESLQAYAGEDLRPISYNYTTLVSGQPKTIDAKFEKGKLLATVHDGGKDQKIVKDIPKGSFLSTFLAYVMLKSPQGLKPDTKYEYQAIAEEDAALVKGIAFVKSFEDFGGLKAMKVLNEFKNSKFISYVNEKGEVLSTRSPIQGIATELVPLPSMATMNMQIPTALLKKLFGDVPLGQKNEVSKAHHEGKLTPSPEPTKKPATKQEGVPPGKGLHLKGAPEKDAPAGE
jgi:hypothetical protein